MNAPSTMVVPSRRIGRSILAILTGILVGIVLSVATDSGLHAVGLAPSLKEHWPNQLLALASVYRLVYGILGSYVIAWLAPSRPMGHSLFAGILVC